MILTCKKCTRISQIEDTYFNTLAGKVIRHAHSTTLLQRDVPAELQCACGAYLTEK